MKITLIYGALCLLYVWFKDNTAEVNVIVAIICSNKVVMLSEMSDFPYPKVR